MLEYARRRVKLFCVNAATLPKVIVAIATIANVEYQSILTVPNATINTRNAAANAAIFAPAASKALTVVGAPSKASGIHMWKGTTAIRSEEHTSELQSLAYLVCRLLLEKKKKKQYSV